MNSQLYFESAPGFGSNIHFCLAFPRTGIAATSALAPKHSNASRKLVSKQNKASKSPLQALVIEDHPASRQIISLQLQALGIEASVCDNSNTALELIGQKHFDLLLTDQSIPGMQGSELAKYLREKGYHNLIIIGITADIYALDSRHQFLEAGMNGVLIKPISLMSLENELSRYFQSEEFTQTQSSPRQHQEAYSFDAFKNLLKESPEYILVILDEIKKVHDEALLTLRNEAVDQASLRSMVHKVKGGAQLLSATQFIRACEALEQGGILDEQISTFTQLLKEQNLVIQEYQSRFSDPQ